MPPEQPPTPPKTTTNYFSNKPFTLLFLIHLTIISILIAALLIHGFLISTDPNFRPKKYLYPLFASIASASLSSLSWALITRISPSGTLKAGLWLTPCLVLATGVILVMAGSPADLGVGILAIILAVSFSIYGCWVVPHLRHGVRVLTICTEFHPPKSILITATAILTSSVFSGFLVAGIGGARAGFIRGFEAYKAIAIIAILLSMGWTMQVIKNVTRVAFTRVHHLKFLQDTETDALLSLREVVGESIETICVGSLLVPVVGLVRGLSRAMEAASGGSDEFMFSCNECFSGLASRMIRHVNRWGFVLVGAYGKKIMSASRDTWDLFERANVLPVIDSDITNAFYFVSGVVGGALSSLVGGIWAFVVHKGYTTEVSVYAFLIGYFMTRIAMAWSQASVLAYYVAYSENPDCVNFDGTIEVRMHELQRHQAE